jgi:hypothetical protein
LDGFGAVSGLQEGGCGASDDVVGVLEGVGEISWVEDVEVMDEGG